MYESESSKSEGSIYQDAKPIKIAKEEDIVHVLGKISASPLESRFVKSGNYISIEHYSEVYTWVDNIIDHGSNTKGNYRPRVVRCDLEWRSEIIPPQKTSSCQNKQFYKPTIQSEIIHPKNAKIEADRNKYLFDAYHLKYSSNIKSENPGLENTILNGLFAVDNYLYVNPNCAEKLIEGCERLSISVIPTPMNDILLIGQLKDSRIKSIKEGDSNEEETSIGSTSRENIYMDTETFEAVLNKFDKENIEKKRGFRYYGFFGILIGVLLCKNFIIHLLKSKFRSIPFYEKENSIALFFFWLAVPFAIMGFIIMISHFSLPVLIISGGIGYFLYGKYKARAV